MYPVILHTHSWNDYLAFWPYCVLLPAVFLSPSSRRDLNPNGLGHLLNVMNDLLCIHNDTMYYPRENWEGSHSKQFLCSAVQMRNPRWERLQDFGCTFTCTSCSRNIGVTPKLRSQPFLGGAFPQWPPSLDTFLSCFCKYHFLVCKCRLGLSLLAPPSACWVLWHGYFALISHTACT